MQYVDVIFRIRKHTTNIVAVFPEIPTEITGEMCKAYSIVDGFISVNYKTLLSQTRSATKDEYTETYESLLGLGHNLNIVAKHSNYYYDIRKKAVTIELGRLE